MASLAPLPAPQLHDVTVVSTRKLAQAKVMGVPPEEFGIERAARNIRDCNYCFHEVVTKTEAQLIDEGYDEDQIKALTNNGSGLNSAARIVKVTEHYIRMDYEGNGRPCLYQVVTGGEQGEVLRKDGKDCVTPFDAIPFAATCPIPQPHRFFGRSIADIVMPLQREKTALKRGILDNIYLHNNARTVVAETGASNNTLDDLLSSRIGGIVRAKTTDAIVPLQVQDVTTSIYPVLQYIDAELATRTGVSKQSQGIDANALQNQSATAVAQVFSASQMRTKLIARVIAEGVKDIFSLLHATIRKHGQQAQTVRLRNQWVNIDPRQWRTRNDMTIHVGLGNGGKAQQFAQLMAIANFQKELILGKRTNLVDDKKIYNLGEEIIKLTGHKNPDRFINDPNAKKPDGSPKYPAPQPAPDPKLQIEQIKQQGKQQEVQIKAQADQQKAQLGAYHEQIQAMADIEVAKFKAQVDQQLALLDANLKAQLAAQQHQHAAQQHHADLASKALDMVATAHAHDTKMEVMREQTKNKPKND
jgi:hypothetical protein